MAQAEMAKIGLLGLSRDQDKVLDVIYDMGEIQLVENKNENTDLVDELSGIEYDLAQVKFSLDFIGRYKVEEKISLRAKLVAALNSGINITDSKIRDLVKDFDYKSVIKKSEELEEQINLKENKIVALKAEIEEIRPWKGMNFNYQDVSSDNIKVKIGVLESTKSENFDIALGGKKLPVSVTRLNPDEKQIKLVLVYLNNVASEVEEVLSEVEFKEVSLPELDSLPSHVISEKEREIDMLEKDITKLRGEAEALAKNENNLKIVFDYLSWQRDKIGAAQNASTSKKTLSWLGLFIKA
jgi:vacuolar-type H+-ATPase subunit I/STV1